MGDIFEAVSIEKSSQGWLDSKCKVFLEEMALEGGNATLIFSVNSELDIVPILGDNMRSTNFSFLTQINHTRETNTAYVKIKAEKKIKNFIFDHHKLRVGVQLLSHSEIYTKSKKKGSLAFGIKLEECLKFERNLSYIIGLGFCQELTPRSKRREKKKLNFQIKINKNFAKSNSLLADGNISWSSDGSKSSFPNLDKAKLEHNLKIAARTNLNTILKYGSIEKGSLTCRINTHDHIGTFWACLFLPLIKNLLSKID